MICLVGGLLGIVFGCCGALYLDWCSQVAGFVCCGVSVIVVRFYNG